MSASILVLLTTDGHVICSTRRSLPSPVSARIEVPFMGRGSCFVEMGLDVESSVLSVVYPGAIPCLVYREGLQPFANYFQYTEFVQRIGPIDIGVNIMKKREEEK